MGILGSMLRAHNVDVLDKRWWTTGGINQSATGVSVTVDSALALSAVWACVKVISESLAMLPLITYRRRSDGGKERAADHPLYDLLHDAPNPQMTAMEFREMLTGHVLLRGNAYAEILPGDRGFVDQLVPLHPDYVTVETAGRHIVRYVYREPGTTERRTVFPDQMFHLKGLSFDGLTGVSVVTYARETFGLALATESYGARVFSQDARPGGVLEHPSRLSDNAAKRIAADFETRHAGLSNAHRFAVLEEGMKWHQVGMTNEDAQFLLTRGFQLREIARWFRMQPHKIGDLEHATFSNIEHQALEHITDTLQPWATRWEQRCNRSLILNPRAFFVEHLFDALLRGDTASRYTAYATARQWGWMNADEIRGRENMNPIPNGRGQDYLTPLNMVPAGTQPRGVASADLGEWLDVHGVDLASNGHLAEREPSR